MNTHKQCRMVGEFHFTQNRACRSCQQSHIKANKCVYLQAMSRLTVLIKLELRPLCSRQIISVPPFTSAWRSPTHRFNLGKYRSFLCLPADTMINPCLSILRTAGHNGGVTCFLLYWFMLMYSRIVPCFYPPRPHLLCYSVCSNCASMALKRAFEAKYGFKGFPAEWPKL